MPYFLRKREDKWCVVKGTKEAPGEVKKCHPTRQEALAHMRALYVHVEDAGKSFGDRKESKATVASDNITGNLIHGSDGILNPMRGGHQCECPKCGKKTSGEKPCAKRECKKCGAKLRKVKEDKKMNQSELKVYKTASGEWRWLTISNVAIEDKEQEIVSEKAYDDAIAWAEANGAFGELDCLHVVDTDVGDCDFMARLGDQLVEGGLWRGDMRSSRTRQKVQDNPDYWGVSIKFKYDPEQFDGKVYKGGIRIPKRTILPRRMAASYGTAIAVTGGEMMKAIDEETKVALTELGFTEDEVTELAERQKALPPEEENVVEKEDETEVIEGNETEVAETPGFWDNLRKTVAEVVGKREKTSEPETVESATAELPKAKTEVEPITEEVQEMVEKRFAEFSQVVAKAVGERVAVLTVAIEDVKTKQQAIEERLAEAEKFVEDKVLERLAELPPIVKVRPTEVSVTATVADNPVQQAVKSAVGALMDDIVTEVKRKTSSAQYEV